MRLIYECGLYMSVYGNDNDNGNGNDNDDDNDNDNGTILINNYWMRFL